MGKRDDLATQLNQLDNKVVSVRDQLDGEAQKVVHGIGILKDLVAVYKTDSSNAEFIEFQIQCTHCSETYYEKD